MSERERITGHGVDRLKNPQRRLPDLTLPSAGEGPPVRLRGRLRDAPLLVLTHGPACSECERYLRALVAIEAELRGWDAWLAAVEPGATQPAAPKQQPPVRLADGAGRVAAALGVEPPAVLIADRYGELHAVEPAGDDHRFPDPTELVAWARYLAIQCPECEGEAF